MVDSMLANSSFKSSNFPINHNYIGLDHNSTGVMNTSTFIMHQNMIVHVCEWYGTNNIDWFWFKTFKVNIFNGMDNDDECLCFEFHSSIS